MKKVQGLRAMGLNIFVFFILLVFSTQARAGQVRVSVAKSMSNLCNNLITTFQEQHPDVKWQGSDLQELQKIQWEALVKSLLKTAERTEEAIQSSKKGALWKAQIAKQLRAQTTAGNSWIAKRLNMGHPSRVTNLIREV